VEPDPPEDQRTDAGTEHEQESDADHCKECRTSLAASPCLRVESMGGKSGLPSASDHLSWSQIDSDHTGESGHRRRRLAVQAIAVRGDPHRGLTKIYTGKVKAVRTLSTSRCSRERSSACSSQRRRQDDHGEHAHHANHPHPRHDMS